MEDFLFQVLKAISEFGGVSWVLKISMIVTLIVSSMKVSFFNDLIWNKLDGFKVWLAPILGLVTGLISLSVNGNLTFAGVFAYFSAGAGAVILHELLDSIKKIPGLGSVYVSIIEAIEKALGGPAKNA